MKRFLVSLIACVLSAGYVSAADVKIGAFKGQWEGNAVSESTTSVSFPLTSRDINVEIRPKPDGSFVLTWRTLQRQSGAPGTPDEVLKETTRTFVPSEEKNVWHDAGKGSILAGSTVSWATLSGQKLTVYSVATTKKGGYDMLIYDRTLTGLGMKLDFKAIRNGNVRRTAGGTLIKSGK